jgi:E3 ubiquitin-protein ligase DOA10
MRSILMYSYENIYYFITITILDIIHRRIFYLKHDVSETETSSLYWAHLSRHHLNTEIESSLQNVVF